MVETWADAMSEHVRSGLGSVIGIRPHLHLICYACLQ